MTRRVIALTGPMGSGKSTIATFMGWRIVSFASPIKCMMMGLYTAQGLHIDEIVRRISGDLKEAPDPYLCGRTPRYAMQTLGTGWGRGMIGASIWVNAWRQSVAMGGDVVADDCRFADEAEAVRAMGGLVVEIARPGVDRDPSHPSEAGVRADVIIPNDDTPEVVAARVLALL